MSSWWWLTCGCLGQWNSPFDYCTMYKIKDHSKVLSLISSCTHVQRVVEPYIILVRSNGRGTYATQRNDCVMAHLGRQEASKAILAWFCREPGPIWPDEGEWKWWRCEDDGAQHEGQSEEWVNAREGKGVLDTASQWAMQNAFSGCANASNRMEIAEPTAWQRYLGNSAVLQWIKQYHSRFSKP